MIHNLMLKRSPHVKKPAAVWAAFLPAFVLTLSAAGLFNAPSATGADIDENKAAAVKAAFLFNFTKFVEWPEASFKGADAPYVIGIAGSEMLKEVLSAVTKGKQVNGRSIEVKPIVLDGKPDEFEAQIRTCHILFVTAKAKEQFKNKREGQKAPPVLIVSDAKGFCEEGGHIQLKLVERTYALRVNLIETRQCGLQVSSKMLRLAEIVKTREEEDGP